MLYGHDICCTGACSWTSVKGEGSVGDILLYETREVLHGRSSLGQNGKIEFNNVLQRFCCVTYRECLMSSRKPKFETVRKADLLVTLPKLCMRNSMQLQELTTDIEFRNVSPWKRRHEMHQSEKRKTKLKSFCKKRGRNLLKKSSFYKLECNQFG